jgi:hypothetical protein
MSGRSPRFADAPPASPPPAGKGGGKAKRGQKKGQSGAKGGPATVSGGAAIGHRGALYFSVVLPTVQHVRGDDAPVDPL